MKSIRQVPQDPSLPAPGGGKAGHWEFSSARNNYSQRKWAAISEAVPSLLLLSHCTLVSLLAQTGFQCVLSMALLWAWQENQFSPPP